MLCQRPISGNEITTELCDLERHAHEARLYVIDGDSGAALRELVHAADCILDVADALERGAA